MLYRIHLIGSAMLNVSELTLDESEARELAQAAQRVKDLYEIPMLDEKTMAWVNLGMVCGMTYGSRAVAYMARVKAERKPNQPRTVTGVTQFPTGTGGM